MRFLYKYLYPARWVGHAIRSKASRNLHLFRLAVVARAVHVVPRSDPRWADVVATEAARLSKTWRWAPTFWMLHYLPFVVGVVVGLQVAALVLCALVACRLALRLGGL